MPRVVAVVLVAGSVSWLASALRAEMLPVENGQVYFEVRGSGPEIVLIHDGLVHHEAWDGQWEPLATNHKVIRYDRRGYGHSPAPTQTYSDIDDLAALLRHVKAPKATIVGASAGGNLAIEFALAHPQSVERLVLVGPIVSGLAFSEHFQRRNAEAFRPLAERGELAATIANWEKDPYLIAGSSTSAKKRLHDLLTANPQNLTRPGHLKRSTVPPALGRLGEIKVPTLIMVGEADIPDVHAHCGAIEAGIRGSKRVVVAKTGHLVFLERPDEFNRLVLNFVAGK